VAAGVVYRTDALNEPGVDIAFQFAGTDHPAISYWAAPLASSEAPRARDFSDFLGSAVATDILVAGGFQPPSSQAPSVRPTDSAPRSVEPLGPSLGAAIRLSVIVALIATVLGLVPAVGLGWLLARREFPGKSLVSTLVLAPLVLPPVVTGFLLLSVFGANTPVGRSLAALGLHVPFTLIGAALAALVVGMPLYVISIRGAFEAVDPSYEELSWTLGSAPRRTFFRVSLPLALPGIAAGGVLAFARALGEFGATVVLAGNVEGSTRTIALAVYTLLESPAGREQIWALVGASVAISLLALLGFEVLSRRQKQRLQDRHGR
jgi:molybdate transport system permease protein